MAQQKAERTDNEKNLVDRIVETDENFAADQETGGIIEQTIDSKAVAGFGQPGGESDISGGIVNLDETAGKKIDQNEYND